MSAVLEKIPNNVTDVVERVILNGISWETYERILSENNEVSNKHFSYSNGDLEIMVLGYQHEKYKQRLSEIITNLALALEIDCVGAASTTFRKRAKKKGFEGDATFYFKNADNVRAKNELDMQFDPSPELVVEIDITHGSLAKFPIFSGLEIEEVWRFNGETVSFYRLQNNKYVEVKESICLPNISSKVVTNLLFSADEMKSFEWIKLIHETVKG
jgi:Uma2 family endonuclease